MARHNTRLVRRPAPRYQWCGHQGQEDLETFASTSAADVTLLCPSLGDTNQQSTVTIEKIFLRMLVTRIGVASVSAAAFVVAIQETVPATGVPVTVINPLDTTADNFTLGLKQILMTGLMEWPPIVLIPSSDAKSVNLGSLLTEYEFNGRRKLNRMNHALTLTMVDDSGTPDLRVFVQARTLLRFS